MQRLLAHFARLLSWSWADLSDDDGDEMPDPVSPGLVFTGCMHFRLARGRS
jgi:hypothetical protein